jgi:hypothetical protein
MSAVSSLTRALLALLALSVSVGASLANADEGLWTFERVPRDLIAARRSVTLDDAWLNHLQLASVRLTAGCSAVFVSAHGLMLTSRGCVETCLADNTNSAADLGNNGFLSRGMSDERRCRRVRAQVLVATEDITGQVQLATAGLDAVAAQNARDRELARLEHACEDALRTDPKAEPLDCEPVALFSGAEYRLYKYRNYDDVRLAFAPERSVARFAGAALDFPRQAFDVALLRVYVEGKPAPTDAFLRVNFAGPAVGEPLFVSGHPAPTHRARTVAELLTDRDTVLPFALLEAAELRGRYAQFALAGASARDHAAEPLASIDRELRWQSALFAALLDERQLARKRLQEEAFKLRLAQDPDFKLTTASAFDDIAAAQQARRSLFPRQGALENGGALACKLCNFANLLIRGAAERQKPDAERLPGFHNADLPQIENALAASAPIALDVESLTLTFLLERVRDRAKASNLAVAHLFATEAPMTIAERVLSHTRLIDPAFRVQLWTAGVGAIVAAEDPLIELARDLSSETQSADAAWRQTVEAPMRRAGERLARARAKFGNASDYSDATGTLRVSSGTMAASSVNGATIAPMTTLSQMFEGTASPTGDFLPSYWLDAKPRITAAAGLDIAIDNDIGAGCPGCAVVSAAGELVGVVFDGNRASVAGRYWFDADANRAIAVDTAALKEILLKVYRADELMKEMVIPR